ncbi:Hsp20/alpha crystallin family protein [Geodermatophilus sp. URMC 61]|uniref:Hsp20/alpha crystallin family protein n=1 Tax=Geodermatophilus sp. URMC 61 TaxID=3423411 RepID=UPI00406CE967
MTLPVRSPSRSTARWDPFRELDELYERVNTLWQSGLTGALDHWSPLADVEEADDAYTVELDLPGVAREDVDIQLDDRRLTVSGDIEEKERKGILHRRTRRVGRFHFSVTLPGDVDADNVSAQLHDGVLTVHVPKAAQARPRRIAISS